MQMLLRSCGRLCQSIQSALNVTYLRGLRWGRILVVSGICAVCVNVAVLYVGISHFNNRDFRANRFTTQTRAGEVRILDVYYNAYMSYCRVIVPRSEMNAQYVADNMIDLPLWIRRQLPEHAVNEWELASIGWPFKCLDATAVNGLPPAGTSAMLDLGPIVTTRVPTLIRWKGAVANLISVMVASSVVWVVVAKIRAISRIWRGNCAVCGYQLRGDLAKGCPECGWNRE